MIVYEKIRDNKSAKRDEQKFTILPIFLFVLFFNVRISIASTIIGHPSDDDVSSFCIRDKCTVVFANGTSVSLPLTEFYNFMASYVGQKGNVGSENDLTIDLAVAEQNGSINSHTDDTIDVDTSLSPANETNTTVVTNTTCDVCDQINSSEYVNDTASMPPAWNFEEGYDANLSSNFRYSRDTHSEGISNDSPCHCRVRSEDGTVLQRSTWNCGECIWIDEKNKTSESQYGKPVTDEDYYYIIPEYDFQDPEPILSVTKEEIEQAKKMTACAKIKFGTGMTCMCNATYCDKFIPPDQTPKWVYTWYTSSNKGLRFRKLRNDFASYKGDEEGAFHVNTSRKYQKIMGFGGSFTDTACKLIKDLSREARKKLLESYFGPFGINYRLGRVPIGGTDFSPRFYTYLDLEDETMANFMLTEQDFKYKIPIILEAIELTHNRLRLVGTAWSAPVWMKFPRTEVSGTLRREYWPLWAKYHIKFLDQYQTNGIKFWAITTGNEPMNYYYITFIPYVNAMEWTPYEQSQWVANHLSPMLKNSSHSDVLLLGLSENREFITFYMKYFYEDYQLKSFDDPTYFHKSRVVSATQGIGIHGYMDYKSNLPYLQKAKELFPNQFLIYIETSCLGAPELGKWECAESYATRMIPVLNNWVTGWIDWNMALDSKGGPTYVHNNLHAPIIVDVKRDEFYKEALFYIMGHFSIFLLPGSYRVETIAPKGRDKIHAVAAHRPDDGKVIVFYNEYESDQQVTFLIDKIYKLSLQVPGKSINSVIFW